MAVDKEVDKELVGVIMMVLLEVVMEIVSFKLISVIKLHPTVQHQHVRKALPSVE